MAEDMQTENRRLRAEVKVLRDWQREVCDVGFGYDNTPEDVAEVLECLPVWNAERIGLEADLAAALARAEALRAGIEREVEALASLAKQAEGLDFDPAQKARAVAYRLAERGLRALLDADSEGAPGSGEQTPTVDPARHDETEAGR